MAIESFTRRRKPFLPATADKNTLEPRSAADWRQQLPVLTGARVVLRELRVSDAPELLAMLSANEVARFISAPPTTVDGFESFIVRTRGHQVAGRGCGFAVTLRGHDTPIGLFQLRETETPFRRAEWGFAIGSAFWGTGLFEEAAALVLEFAFEQLNVHRLEARAAVRNGRGNRALQKLGAVMEGVLRQALLCGDEYVDQAIYGIVQDEWRAARRVTPRRTFSRVH